MYGGILKRFALVFGVLALAGSAAYAESGWIRVRVFPQSEAEVQRICDSPLRLFSDDVTIGATDLAIGPREMPKLWSLGLRYRFISELPDPVGWENRAGEDGTDYRNSYLRYDDIIALYETWRAANPRLMSRVQIGTSIGGRIIWGYRIFSNRRGDAEIPPKSLLILGGTHAREWITESVVMYIVDSILGQLNTPSSPLEAKLADKCALYVVPCINPDGYEYCWTSDRLWRKNRRNNGNGTFGVDINRNWSVGWGGTGSSGSGGNETYRGTAPFSEPETTSVKNFAASLPALKGFIDFHSYGQYILYPWSYLTTGIPQASQYQTIGNSVRSAILGVNGVSFTVGQASTTLYIAAGVSKDYTYATFGCPSYTIELRDTGANGFILPADQITPSQNETWEGFKAFINAVLP